MQHTQTVVGYLIVYTSHSNMSGYMITWYQVANWTAAFIFGHQNGTNNGLWTDTIFLVSNLLCLTSAPHSPRAHLRSLESAKKLHLFCRLPEHVHLWELPLYSLGNQVVEILEILEISSMKMWYPEFWVSCVYLWRQQWQHFETTVYAKGYDCMPVYHGLLKPVPKIFQCNIHKCRNQKRS